jgi:F-type H+-transporting ATPase subunit gamma
MTDRLADIESRIQGMHQLSAVVNAMRGMAAARAQQARGQLAAVESYAATIAGAIGSALTLAPDDSSRARAGSSRRALVLFCAEQGFAGAFSERVLNAAGASLQDAEVLLIGARGQALAADRGLHPGWTSAMPSHTQGIPSLADHIVEALFARMVTGSIEQLDVVFSRWQPSLPIQVETIRLFPIDLARFSNLKQAASPLIDLVPLELLQELTAAYLHAQLCDAALHAFAAENQARMEAMAAAHQQIKIQLASLQSRQRQVRQEEITAEIIELAAGEESSRESGGGF